MQDSRKILEDYYICKRTPVCEKIFFQKDSFKDKVKGSEVVESKPRP